MKTLFELKSFNTNKFTKYNFNLNEFEIYITSCNCCRMKNKNKYNYVKYEDDMKIRNNIMFDMKNINFTPDFDDNIEWTNCSLYEDNQ